MPLPLVAIGIGIGVAGAAGGILAARRLRRDQKRYDSHRERYERKRSEYEDFVNRVNAGIDDLHNQRVAAVETLTEAADFLVRANVKDRTWNVDFKVTTQQFEELKDVVASLGHLAASAAGGVAGGAGVGAVGVAGAYGAVGAFGVAGTCAPIAGLAGAAARNATLAWLGGGPLALGGGGVAAGIMSLVSIGLAPLAVVPALVLAVKARNQSRRVDDAIAAMDVSEAEMGRHRAELTALQKRMEEVSLSLSQVEQALKDILGLASVEVIEDVYMVATAAKALADLLDLDS